MKALTPKKRIGILGGISYTSTIKYYEVILTTYYQRYNNYYYPEIVIFSLDFQKFTDFENENEKKYIEYIMEGIVALEKAGAECVVMAANSPHAVFEEIERQSNIPLLSIVEVTARKAVKKGMKILLLLGIKFTMQSLFYEKVCKKYGITVVVPSAQEQDEINAIIFDELVISVFKEESKKRIVDIIRSYQVDGVILGCTELPLLLNEDIGVPVLDTLELHAEAALSYSLSL
jgi:aspartate racemase